MANAAHQWRRQGCTICNTRAIGASTECASLCLLDTSTNRSCCISIVDVVISSCTFIAKQCNRFQLIRRKLPQPSICCTAFGQMKCDTLAYNTCLDWISQFRKHERRKPISKRLVGKERHCGLVTPQVLNTVPTPCRPSEVIHDALVIIL